MSLTKLLDTVGNGYWGLSRDVEHEHGEPPVAPPVDRGGDPSRHFAGTSRLVTPPSEYVIRLLSYTFRDCQRGRRVEFFATRKRRARGVGWLSRNQASRTDCARCDARRESQPRRPSLDRKSNTDRDK